MTRSRLRTAVLLMFIAAGVALLFWASPSTLERASQTLATRDTVAPRVQAAIARGAVSGHVLASEGGPIAGAAVCAVCYDCNQLQSDHRQHCARTDNLGAYQLELAASETLLFLASADGFLPQRLQRPIRVETERAIEGVDFALARGGVELSGQVIDVLGGAVAGAEVRVITGVANEQRTIFTRASDEGAFRIWGPAGLVSVLATAAGYAPARMDSVAPAKGLQLALTPGGTIRGRVVTASDGRPVAQVRVRARRDDEPTDREDSYATTDDAGNFAIEGLFPGRFNLIARAEHYRGTKPVGVELQLGEQVNGLVIPVESALVIRGEFIVEEKQGSCAYGDLALFAAEPTQRLADLNEGTPAAHFAKLQRDGSILVESVNPGHYLVRATCGNHLLKAGPEVVDVSAVDVSDLRWIFKAGHRVEAIALNASGKPLDGMWLTLDPVSGEAESKRIGYTGITAADGRYEFSGLVSGTYELSAPSLPNTKPVRLELSPATPFETVTFKAESDSEVVVQVRSHDASRDSGILVYAIKHEVATQETAGPAPGLPISPQPKGGGLFVFKPISPGEYEIFVSDRRNPTLRIPREDGSFVKVPKNDKVVLDVEYGGYDETLTGNVIDDRGAPVENVWVSAVHDGMQSNLLSPAMRFIDGESRSLTSRDGAFEIRGLAPNASYTVRVEQPVGGVSSLKRAVRSGSKVELVLPAPAQLSGAVVDANGEPVRQFDLLAISTTTDSQLSNSIADDRGQWTLRDVPVGALKLMVRAGSGTGELELEPKPGQALADLRIVLSHP
jgi:protocatechuate 3,4-dioxygenase beta subunit